VYAAALRLVGSEGVSGLSVDLLAEESGVSRSTIYRHWPDMGDLVVRAFDDLMHAHVAEDLVRGTDVSAALLAYLRDYARRLNDPSYASALVAILEWSWRDEAFATTHGQMFSDSRSRAATLLRAGRASGELRADLDVSQGVEDVVASFLYRRIVLRRRITDREVEALHARVMTDFGARSPRS